MRVSFVRTVGEKDRVYVLHDDGSETSWSFASYGDGLPHDLVHLVLEATVGLDHGIWARVAAGADLARINAEANRAGGKLRDKYAGLAAAAAAGAPADLDQVLVSEILANAGWGRDHLDGLDTAARVTRVFATLAEARLAAPPGCTPESLALAAARLAALAARWRALGSRGALVLHWPPRPDSDFAAAPG